MRLGAIIFVLLVFSDQAAKAQGRDDIFLEHEKLMFKYLMAGDAARAKVLARNGFIVINGPLLTQANQTYLTYFSSYCNLSAVQTLIEIGADPNLGAPLLPLHAVASFGGPRDKNSCLSTIKDLVDAGAEIKSFSHRVIKNNGYQTSSSLLQTSINLIGYPIAPELFDYLRSKGSDVNERVTNPLGNLNVLPNGESAENSLLHKAAEKSQTSAIGIESVKVLISNDRKYDKNPNFEYKNKYGYNPEQWNRIVTCYDINHAAQREEFKAGKEAVRAVFIAESGKKTSDDAYRCTNNGEYPPKK